MTRATLARHARPTSRRLQTRVLRPTYGAAAVIRGDAEAGLRGRLEDPGELAAAFPDMLADDTSDKNVIRPASIIPAAGLELLRGQPEIQRRGNRWRQI